MSQAQKGKKNKRRRQYNTYHFTLANFEILQNGFEENRAGHTVLNIQLQTKQRKKKITIALKQNSKQKQKESIFKEGRPCEVKKIKDKSTTSTVVRTSKHN
jgi:hypothetical protein